jgi:molybdopterin-guanine dinucleotide biosynthesis protein A
MRFGIEFEAVVLAGGKSSRMGYPKGSLRVGDETLLERTVWALLSLGPVTVLGPEAPAGAVLLADAETYAGPASALSRYSPSREWVFVASCDMPRFDAQIPKALSSLAAASEAVVPVALGHRQPLCALYRDSAFEQLRACVSSGGRSMMAWLDRLDVREVDEDELRRMGLDPLSIRGANTPSEVELELRG